MTQAKYGFWDGTIGALFDTASLFEGLTPDELKNVTGGVFTSLWAGWDACSISHGWCAYVEVRDYNDTNGNGRVDSNDVRPGGTAADLWGKPYWMEVRGVWTQASGQGQYVEGFGYLRPDAAYNAAVAVYEEYNGPQAGNMNHLNIETDYEGDVVNKTNHPFSRRRVKHIDSNTAKAYLPDDEE